MIISVIVPVYNSEKYIENCVDSILNQTYKKIELILIDDGSNNETIQLLKQIENKDIRVKLKLKNNSGVSNSRNVGLDIATGDYIYFMDSDDEIKPNFFQSVYESILHEKSDLIVYNYITKYQFKNQKENKHILQNDLLLVEDNYNKIGHHIKSGIMTPIWNKIYKNSLIKKYDLKFDENLSISEDAMFNYSYIRHCKEILFLKEAYYIYYIRSGESLTLSFKKNQYEMLMKTNSYLFEVFENNKMIQKIASSIRLKNIYSTLANNFHKNSNVIDYTTRKNYIKSIVEKENKLKKIRFKNLNNLLDIIMYLPIKYSFVNIIFLNSYIMHKIKSLKSVMR